MQRKKVKEKQTLNLKGKTKYRIKKNLKKIKVQEDVTLMREWE